MLQLSQFTKLSGNRNGETLPTKRVDFLERRRTRDRMQKGDRQGTKKAEKTDNVGNEKFMRSGEGWEWIYQAPREGQKDSPRGRDGRCMTRQRRHVLRASSACMPCNATRNYYPSCLMM